MEKDKITLSNPYFKALIRMPCWDNFVTVLIGVMWFITQLATARTVELWLKRISDADASLPQYINKIFYLFFCFLPKEQEQMEASIFRWTRPPVSTFKLDLGKRSDIS